MLLWLICAGLTAAVVVAVLRPVLSGPAPAASIDADLAVYRAQLIDLDAQARSGRLDPDEHAALRHEVSRRILRLAPLGTTTARPGAPEAATVALATAGLVPVLAIAVYVWLGHPDLPGRPYDAANAAPVADASGAQLIAKVEALLATHPEDGRGWDVIAPLYLRMQRFADAADAYQRAARLLGDTPQRLAGFAEATVMANDGIVTDAARTAYEKLAAADPGRFEARFWLALAKEQDGQRDAAADAYRSLLAAAPAKAPWRALVEQHLAKVSGASPSPPPRGPSASDAQAASALSEDQRAAMIAGMVETLASRLKTDGHNLAGWQRLVTSYVTLKQPAKASAALADARSALAGDGAAMVALDGLARRLGIQP